MPQSNKITPLGYFLILTLFILLSYAGWIYTKSIDRNVLKRMENSPLTLPTIIPTPIPTKTITN